MNLSELNCSTRCRQFLLFGGSCDRNCTKTHVSILDFFSAASFLFFAMDYKTLSIPPECLNVSQNVSNLHGTCIAARKKKQEESKLKSYKNFDKITFQIIFPSHEYFGNKKTGTIRKKMTHHYTLWITLLVQQSWPRRRTGIVQIAFFPQL